MIERHVLCSMLRDIGIAPLAMDRRKSDDEEYSPKLFLFLEKLVDDHDLKTTHDLMRLLNTDCYEPEPYQFTVVEAPDAETQTTHVAYLLDFPEQEVVFTMNPDGTLPDDLGNYMREMMHRKHALYMQHRMGIPLPENYTNHHTGPIHRFNLGQVYAIKIAAYNESLAQEDLPPSARREPGDYYH